jgi:hypothetical protein
VFWRGRGKGAPGHIDTAEKKVAIITRMVYNPKMPNTRVRLTMRKIAIICICLTLLSVVITGATGCIKQKYAYESKSITIVNESGQPLSLNEAGENGTVPPGQALTGAFSGPDVEISLRNDRGETVFHETFNYAELEKMHYTVRVPPPPNDFFARITAEPEKFNGQTVTFTGYVFHGFESAVICQYLNENDASENYLRPGGIQIWYTGAMPDDVEKKLHVSNNDPTGYPAYYGRVEVTGIFQYGGKYGHMDAYKYQIQITGAKYIPWEP